jgi:hypothetical protein
MPLCAALSSVEIDASGRPRWQERRPSPWQRRGVFQGAFGHHLQALDGEHPTNGVEHTVVRDSVNLAPCLQDAAPPAGSTVVSDAPVRRCDLANRTVEELLPLVGKGRATPLAVCVVRPVSADAVVCMS